METVLSTASRQAAFHIGEQSEIAAARRAGSEIARLAGFDATAAGQLAIMITEAATNIVKHASAGEILLRPVRRGDMDGIEVIAIDVGPGMVNLAASMRDGTSTAGSYGVGLGAMERLADEFDVYTVPGKGTVLRMTLWTGAEAGDAAAWQVGVVCLPMPGESVSGDAWAVGAGATMATLMVADGLGHGPDAAMASEGATAAVAQYPDASPSTVMQHAHGMLRATRGAAVAVARLDTVDEEIHFAGVGNIAASVHDDHGRRQLVSHNGIVGSNMRKVQEFSLPWTPHSMIVMHSDGLGSRWDLDHYPGLSLRHPALIAAVLYRDFARRRDDVSVLVVRNYPEH